MEPNESRGRKGGLTLYMFLALLAGFLVINFKMVAPYLVALLIGAMLALLSRPLYEYLRQQRRGPKTSALVVTVAVALLLVIPLLAFLAVAGDQAISLADRLSHSEGFSLESIKSKLTQFGPLRTLVGDPDAIEKQMRETLQNSGKAASSWVLAVAGAVPDFLLQLVLALGACFFFLVDGKRFLGWMKDKIPLEPDVREKLVTSFRESTLSTTWATLAAAVTQAIIVLISFLVLGVPAAFLAGCATFFFAWVPILGSTPVTVIGTIYLFMQGATTKGVIMIVLGVITGISDNVVRPWVLKGRGEMHPLVGLVAIFGGIQMFGILGVFLGPILVAILISLLEIWPVIQRRFRLRDGMTALRVKSAKE